MRKFYLPSCPYCGAPLGYTETFVAKNRALYKCKICEKKSEVSLGMFIYKYLWSAQAAAIIVFVISALLGGKFSLIGLFLILLTFSAFYVISPYAVGLSPPEVKFVSYENNPESLKKKIADKIKDAGGSGKKGEGIDPPVIGIFTDVFSGETGNQEGVNIDMEDTDRENMDKDINSN